MEGRSSTSQAGSCTFMPDSVPYVRARQGNSCFFGSPPSSPSYSEGYRALYEEDDLNLSVLYRSMMAPSPEHAPLQRPPPKASLFTTPPPALPAPGLVLPPPRMTGGPNGSNAGSVNVEPTMRSPTPVAGDHEQDTPEDWQYVWVCIEKSCTLV